MKLMHNNPASVQLPCSVSDSPSQDSNKVEECEESSKEEVSVARGSLTLQVCIMVIVCLDFIQIY